MRAPKAHVAHRVTTIGSLAQLGAISNANTHATGQPVLSTRPIAHVAVPTSPVNNSALSQAPNLSNTPIAHPVGISGVNLGELQSSLQSGPTGIGGTNVHVSRPTNYPLRAEE